MANRYDIMAKSPLEVAVELAYQATDLIGLAKGYHDQTAL